MSDPANRPVTPAAVGICVIAATGILSGTAKGALISQIDETIRRNATDSALISDPPAADAAPKGKGRVLLVEAVLLLIGIGLLILPRGSDPSLIIDSDNLLLSDDWISAEARSRDPCRKGH